MTKEEIIVLKEDEAGFPARLAELPQPVHRLYCRGDISLLTLPAMAVVGSRKCSEYGRRTAREIAGALARAGAVTVSGMAYGIDSMAHWGALQAGGKTIAVLGSGPDICYPPGNGELYAEICARGLVLSEYPPGTPVRPWHFPQRNRIIAALAQAVAVVEAGENSGACITALRAAEIGSEVFALPGNITSTFSIGSNRLIRDGARIIVSVSELLCEAGLAVCKDAAGAADKAADRNQAAATIAAPGRNPAAATAAALGAEEKRVYLEVARQSGASVDSLCAALNFSPARLSGILAVLEIKGMIYHDQGKVFIAKF